MSSEAVAVCGESRTHGDNGGDGKTQCGCASCPYPLLERGEIGSPTVAHELVITTADENREAIFSRVSEAILRRSPGTEMDGRHPAHSLCSLGRAGDLSPGLELLRHLLTVFGGRAEVTSRSEVLDNGAISGEKALGVTR
jgi:hypothetical protein